MALSRSPGDTAKLVMALNEGLPKADVAGAKRQLEADPYGELTALQDVGASYLADGELLSVFWQKVEGSLEKIDSSFVEGLPEREEVLDFLCFKILDLLNDNIEATDFGNEDQRAFKDRIKRNVVVGVKALLSFVDVVPKVFMQQFGKEISAEEFFRIINGRSFLALISAIGSGHGAVMGLSLIIPLQIERREVDGRLVFSHFDPSKFYFASKNGVRTLEISTEAFENAEIERVLVTAAHGVKLVVSGCPMHAAKDGDGRSAFLAFVKWVLAFVNEHYVPRFEAKEQSGPSDEGPIVLGG